MQRENLYKRIKLLMIVSCLICWTAIAISTYFYPPIGLKINLTETILILWSFQQLSKLIVFYFKDSEAKLYSFLVDQKNANTVYKELEWQEVRDKISFESAVSKPYLSQALGTMGTGVVFIDRDLQLKLSEGFSFQSFFGEPEDKNAIDYLFSSLKAYELSDIKYILSVVFDMPKLQWDILSSKLPEEIKKLNSEGTIDSFRFFYVPHFTSEGLQRITVIVQDQSEIKKDQKIIETQSNDIKKFFSILSIPDSVFELYMDETSRIFRDFRRMLKLIKTENFVDDYLIENMLRLVHTLKANSGLFGLLQFSIKPTRWKICFCFFLRQKITAQN